jgi:hypothetical protein
MFQKQKKILTQDFSENENQNHANEESRLLRSTADTSVTDNTDRKTSSHTRKADCKASAELDETRVERIAVLCETVRDQDRDDETVDTDDTSHNDGDNVCTKVSITCPRYPRTLSDAGDALLTMRSGRRTPMAAMPTPDLAVPYEAPRQVKTIDAVQPMAPKKGCARSVRERVLV